MLYTSGRDILDTNGNKVVLRGINLGSWLLMESNMMGIPGVESRVYRGILLEAGQEKADRFFKNVFDKWVTEDDIRYLKELGANSVRIPFNYRRFETDQDPYHYKDEGFIYLDRVLEWCAKHEVYAVLDLHAVQGFQNEDWHSDNARGACDLFTDIEKENRFVALWEAIAARYLECEWLAGYDLMNEPVAYGQIEVDGLNRVTRRAAEAIRRIDAKHILFIEGNFWATDFSEMDPPFDDNVVYSSHYYCPAAVQIGRYPGEADGVLYDQEQMIRDVAARDEYMLRHNVPTWVGEFGVRRFENLKDKGQAFRDYIAAYEKLNDSWCYWNFKDLGLRGPLYLDPDGPWCRFVKEICDLKAKYQTDYANALDDKAWDLSSIIGCYQEGDFACSYATFYKRFTRTVRSSLGDFLTERFGQMFVDLSPEDIDALTDSFLFGNCKHYEPWEEILKAGFAGTL